MLVASRHCAPALTAMLLACPSYIPTCIDLIRILSQIHLQPHFLLITPNVSSFYTNISPSDAVDTLDRTFSNEPPSPYRPPTLVLRLLLSYVLQNNVLTFNGEIFSPKHSVAMGTKLAPALATLFLSHIETDFTSSTPHKPDLWLQYTDDVFCVWNKGGDIFNTFPLKLNAIKARLRFTASISEDRATFLDLDVFKGALFDSKGTLDTEIQYKPTNNFTFVHSASFNPKTLLVKPSES